MKIDKNKGITAAKGWQASGVAGGIKASGKKDLALIYSRLPAETAAAFTSNQVVAAPVTVCRELLKKEAKTQAVVVNSGNANACTGAEGIINAREMARLVKKGLNLRHGALVASTGIIGEQLPMDKIGAAISLAIEKLDVGGGRDAAEAIMTTDAFLKQAAVAVELGGTMVHIGGMAKGAGMIAPRLMPHATMIVVVTTDAVIAPKLLKKSLNSAINRSFNRATVDGNTSTNDTVLIMANGASANKKIEEEASPDYEIFQRALEELLICFAKMIVSDGEGATKLITYNIIGAATEAEAATIGISIANSILVKAAFFGEDPNWGRILVAAGMAGVSLTADKLALSIGDVALVKEGQGIDYDRPKIKNILAAPEIDVTLNLNQGKSEAVCFGCDLTYDYVKINAEYHT